MKKHATAVWNGTGKEGSGYLSTESGSLSKSKYTWATRFTDAKGTNPEELIAAAHSGCFSMKLSFVLGNAGFTPESIETKSTVTIENGAIESSELELKAKITGITNEQFQQCAEEAKNQCPVSKALNVKISLKAELI